MALHDPALIEAFETNQRAKALANVPETAIRNFEAMSIGERRWAHLNAEMQAKRNDALAEAPSNRECANYYRVAADGYRATADALKAIGL